MTTRISAPGYAKQRGVKSERDEMTAEAQHQVEHLDGGKAESGIFIRVGVVPKPGDRPLDDLTENAIRLSLDQAREFAETILSEVARAEAILDRSRR